MPCINYPQISSQNYKEKILILTSKEVSFFYNYFNSINHLEE